MTDRADAREALYRDISECVTSHYKRGRFSAHDLAAALGGVIGDFAFACAPGQRERLPGQMSLTIADIAAEVLVTRMAAEKL